MKIKRRPFQKTFAMVKHRWINAMPTFFRRLFWVCSLISGTALAINTAITAGGGIPHDWWQDIYPYLLGFPAGIAFAAKFTQQYNGNPVNYDDQKVRGGNVGDNGEQEPEKNEIEPYNDI